MAAFLVHFASQFTLALWVGAGAALSFVAAPVVFEKAPSRALAGELVGSMLKRLDTYVLVGGPIALAAVFVELAGTVGAPRTLSLKLALVAAMLGLAAYARFGLRPELERIRQEVGAGWDALPKEDARRRAFGRLHGFSIGCLLGQLLLGGLALALGVMTLTAKVG